MKVKQSNSGIVREHLGHIENQISLGIRHESIVEQLQARGATIDLASFRTVLYRARKLKKEQEASQQRPATTAPKKDPPTKEIQPEPETVSTNNPGSIDDIINRQPKATAVNRLLKGNKK